MNARVVENIQIKKPQRKIIVHQVLILSTWIEASHLEL